MCLAECVCVCVGVSVCVRALSETVFALYCIAFLVPTPYHNPAPKRTQAKHEKPQSCLGWGYKQALHIDLIDLSCVSCARELSIEETIE